MAYEIDVLTLSFTPTTALSTLKNLFVNLVSGEVTAPSAGGQVVGVLQDVAQTTTANSPVRAYGVTRVLVGTGGLTQGDLVTCNAGGLAVAATAGDIVHGVALETSASGVVGTVLLNINGHVVPTP